MRQEKFWHFFLNPEIFVENYPDTTNVVTNWRAHMTEMVGKWLDMELVKGNKQDMNGYWIPLMNI